MSIRSIQLTDQFRLFGASTRDVFAKNGVSIFEEEGWVIVRKEGAPNQHKLPRAICLIDETTPTTDPKPKKVKATENDPATKAKEA